MPEFVSAPPDVTGALRGAAIGFCGKLPARGDFVAARLPRRFVEPWHDWVERMLAASRDRLGEGWLPAWLEAPVWHFALMPGVCGLDAALGLWLPSVDRVGRYFPLTLAAIVPDGDTDALLAAGGDFLAAAEEAGLDALAQDLAPDDLAVRLAAAGSAEPRGCAVDPPSGGQRGALWWSDGSERVPAAAFATAALPDAAQFVAMLDAGALVREAAG